MSQGGGSLYLTKLSLHTGPGTRPQLKAEGKSDSESKSLLCQTNAAESLTLVPGAYVLPLAGARDYAPQELQEKTDSQTQERNPWS